MANFNNQEDASIQEIVSRLYTHMALSGVQYGFLTCWFFTWLIHRPLNNCDVLQVSKPISSMDECSESDGKISTTTALAWLEDHAIKQTHQEGRRHGCIHNYAADYLSFVENVEAEVEEEMVEENDAQGNNDHHFDPSVKEKYGLSLFFSIPLHEILLNIKSPLLMFLVFFSVPCRRRNSPRKGKGQVSTGASQESRGSKRRKTCRKEIARLTVQATPGLQAIGSGSSGFVLQGQVIAGDLPGRLVAIKVFSRCADSVSASQAEASIYNYLEDLQGVVIPTYLGIGRIPLTGSGFILTSLVKGRPLSCLDEKERVKEVAEAARQALSLIHQRGVAHGDVRLENILLLDNDDEMEEGDKEEESEEEKEEEEEEPEMEEEEERTQSTHRVMFLDFGWSFIARKKTLRAEMRQLDSLLRSWC